MVRGLQGASIDEVQPAGERRQALQAAQGRLHADLRVLPRTVDADLRLEGEGKSLQEGRPPHASVRDPQGRRGPQEVQAVIPMAVAVINALLSVLLVIVVAWAAIWLVERMPLVPTEFKQVFI